MDIRDYLEKAKEILQRDKNLMSVLFVETEDQMFVLGIVTDGKIDIRKIMTDLGKNFAKKYEEKRLKTLLFIFETLVTRINTDMNKSEIIDAIVVSKWNIKTDKKEVITQDFEILNDSVIWKDGPKEVEETRSYILDAFMQGYNHYINLDKIL
jgi:hypothetical protein